MYYLDCITITIVTTMEMYLEKIRDALQNVISILFSLDEMSNQNLISIIVLIIGYIISLLVFLLISLYKYIIPLVIVVFII